MYRGNRIVLWVTALSFAVAARGAEDPPKPYSPPCTEREDVFEFMDWLTCVVQRAGDIDECEIEHGAFVLFTESNDVFGSHESGGSKSEVTSTTK